MSASDSDPSQSPTDLIEQLIPDLGQVAPVVPPTPTFTDPDNTGLVLDVTPLVSAPPTISEPTVSLFPPAPVLDTPNAGLDTPTIVNPEPGTLLLFGSGLALAANRVRRRR